MAHFGDVEVWDPLTVWRAIVVDLQTLRWSLSEAPDPDWIAAFRNAPTSKRGSTEYLTSGFNSRAR